MGKAKRLKKKKQEAQKLSKILTSGNGLETLTDDLMEKLSKEQGMPLQELKELQKNGAQYSKSRNSFFFPPEIEMFE